MTTDLPPDTEKYRQQLEARARIYFQTSDIWLRVIPRATSTRALESTSEEEGDWVADLHHRSSSDDSSALAEPYAEHPGGFGSSPERALEDFAEQLDVRERERESVQA
ncbi:MAG: hypothetical protein RLZZ450_5552 [Pseudomonadota bacterium]|jgi:hypothetical protein